MGNLKSTHHIWSASGRNLYIWNYLTQNAITHIESAEDNIENVEIIKLSTHSLLVVSTSYHVFLHKIMDSIENSRLVIDMQNSSVTKTYNVVMSNFQTAKNTQRIFAQGSNGYVYELVNRGTNRAEFIHRTASVLSYYLYLLLISPRHNGK
jgi:hypothetical protein